MSEVFEGVITRAPANAVCSTLELALVSLALRISELSGLASVVYRNDSRQSSTFAEEMDRLAKTLSDKLSKAVLVRYDSRIGHRSATLYVKGALNQRFGRDDELFVPLDNAGNPMMSSSPIHFLEFVEGEEYETIQNAIELVLGFATSFE
jgi:hypothetical protein